MGTTFETLNWSVQIDPGTPYEVADLVISAEVSLGTNQDNASAVVRLREYPADLDLRYRLYIYASRFGGTPPLIFNGEVTNIRENLADGTVTAEAQCYMGRLKYPWSREVRTYTAEDASSVLQNLVEASGIDVSLTSITSPSGWTIGVGADVLLNTGDTPLELIRAILEAMPLWYIATRGDGAIYAGPIVAGSSVATFTAGGSNVLSMEIGYGLEGLANAVRVTGANYNDVPIEELYQTTSSYIPDPPQYITENVDNYLIEDPVKALSVATDIATFKAEPRNRAALVVLLNEDVNPGETVTIQGSTYFVETVRHSIPACTTAIEAINI